jgi:tripeptidyl-peptidase I
MLSKSFVFLSLLALASSSPMAAYSNMIVHNTRQAPPAGFKATGPAPSDMTFDLRIAMVSNNIAGLEKALYDVSTPGGANYRKFLTKEQVSHTFHISTIHLLIANG